MEEREYGIMYEQENDYWWYRGLHELVLQTLGKYIGGRKDVSILDAGCGTGRMLELLSDYSDKEGFDYSPEAVRYCKRRGLEDVRCRDLMAWDEPKGKYDCIISLDVLYHAAIKDDAAVMMKFHEALRVGGILILNLPAFNYLRRNHDEAVWTRRRYSRSGLEDDLRRVGFKIEMASYRLPFLYCVVFVRRVAENLFRKNRVESDFGVLPPFVNRALLFINRLENAALLRDISLPVGSSVFIVCRKGSE